MRTIDTVHTLARGHQEQPTVDQELVIHVEAPAKEPYLEEAQ